ncbi:hypothetical protein HPMBJEAJ_00348 [Aeromonas phage avDM6]|nr:hypothetical protein HPMBJEAJ_00348 [Aeromonas phage avDM6]
MKNENAKMFSEMDGYQDIAICLEKYVKKLIRKDHWETQGPKYKYKTVDIVPPVACFEDYTQVACFFRELENTTDTDLEFVGKYRLHYGILSFNDSISNVDVYDRNGKLISKHETKDTGTSNNIWIYKLGNKLFSVKILSQKEDYDMMSRFEFDTKLFNNSLRRFVNECRLLVGRGASSDPAFDLKTMLDDGKIKNYI